MDSPKEKAYELFEKMLYNDGDEYHHCSHYVGKKCALIAVDELIKSREDDGAFNDTKSSEVSEYYTPHPMYLTYWIEVKKEIENL